MRRCGQDRRRGWSGTCLGGAHPSQFIPGWLVVVLVLAGVGTLLLIVVRVPTGAMVERQAHNPRWQRWLQGTAKQGGGDVK